MWEFACRPCSCSTYTYVLPTYTHTHTHALHTHAHARLLCRNDFREIGLLGHGNYSRVYRVRHRLNGHEYAVKRSTRDLRPEDPAFQQFIQVGRGGRWGLAQGGAGGSA